MNNLFYYLSIIYFKNIFCLINPNNSKNGSLTPVFARILTYLIIILSSKGLGFNTNFKALLSDVSFFLAFSNNLLKVLDALFNDNVDPIFLGD